MDPLSQALAVARRAQQVQAWAARQPKTNEQIWRERLAGQGSISKPQGSIGGWIEEKTSKALGGLLGNERRGAQIGERLFRAVNDLTPVGNVTGAEEGGRMALGGLTRGDLGTAALGAGSFALSVLPGGAQAKRIGGNLLGKLIRDESGAIRAWHGSPHDFDRFDMSKIGTGEGAQAYGHGLYFAENRRVAEDYRNTLSDLALEVPGRGTLKPAEAARHFGANDEAAKLFDEKLKLLARNNGRPDPYALEMLPTNLYARPYDAHPNDIAAYDAALDAAEAALDAGARPKFGSLYEVNINAEPEDFLDWDAPLAQQQGRVRDFLGGLEAQRQSLTANIPQLDGSIPYDEVERRYGPALEAAAKLRVDPDYTGRTLYSQIDGMPLPQGSPFAGLGVERAPRTLRELGVPGIKYFDQGSRGSGSGTRNYVVFDDNLIDILGKY